MLSPLAKVACGFSDSLIFSDEVSRGNKFDISGIVEKTKGG